MKKIGFVGVYDKTDLILCIAEILVKAKQKVLFIDATTTQKSKYIVPVIKEEKSYITEFLGIDIAIGYDGFESIKHNFEKGLSEIYNYDYVFIDSDSYEGFKGFELAGSDILYYLTSFDAYSLKKGVEILKHVDLPVRMTKIFFSKEMTRYEEEYFDYLTLGLKAEWNENKLFFLLENGDQAALIENERLAEIKLKNLSLEYRENVIYLTQEIGTGNINERIVRNIVKDM